MQSPRERERFESRAFSIFPDDDCMYVVRGRLTPEVGALLMRALDAAGDALFCAQWRPRSHDGAADTAQPSPPSQPSRSAAEAAQRRADAVALLAERALSAGLAGEAPVSGTRAARYQVVLHVDAADLAAEEAAASDLSRETCREPERSGRIPDPSSRKHLSRETRTHQESTCRFQHASRPPHLEDGTRVTHETARRLCCVASIVEVRHARDGSVLDVGRRRRTIPPALRRALEVRDGGCRFPGCGLRFTDAHHVRHWADGGETSLANCMLLCGHHHRFIHESGWRVEWWGRDVPVFIDPRGNAHTDTRPLRERSGPGLLLERNRRRGVAPDEWSLGARFVGRDW